LWLVVEGEVVKTLELVVEGEQVDYYRELLQLYFRVFLIQ
jgi:hypothetical protein